MSKLDRRSRDGQGSRAVRAGTQAAWLLCAASLLFGAMTAGTALAAPAKPPPLTTPWTNQALVGVPLPEYPRPQMVRPDWLNLNGEWQLRQSATNDTPVFGQALPERINVPFPVESALSGIMRAPGDNRHYLFYRRTFAVPAAWAEHADRAPARPRHQRRSVHPDHRRRGGGQWLLHLRSPDPQGRWRPRAGREPELDRRIEGAQRRGAGDVTWNVVAPWSP